MITTVTVPVRGYRRGWAAAGAIVLLTWSQFAWVSREDPPAHVVLR